MVQLRHRNFGKVNELRMCSNLAEAGACSCCSSCAKDSSKLVSGSAAERAEGSGAAGKIVNGSLNFLFLQSVEAKK